jgi:mRNA interferase HicA
MNSKELERWLKKQGAEITTKGSGHGHVIVKLNGLSTELPRHGSRKEIGPGLVAKIKRELGLK